MRRYYLLSFLILTVLFHNNSGECSLYEFDFKGYITEISSYPEVPTSSVEDILGVSIGSKMKVSSIYDTYAYLEFSNEFVDVYRTNIVPVLNFKTFTVVTSNEIVMYKDPIFPYDLTLGSSTGGFLNHEDGWNSTIYGASPIWFKNKTGISYTLESFPTILNTDNFDIGFSFGAFILGGEPLDETQPWGPQVIVSGVIDKFNVHPVPEPSTLLLLGSGLIGLVGYGRRRVKK